MSLHFTSRVATEADVFELMKVWHLDSNTQRDEDVFINLADFRKSLNDPQTFWLLLINEGQIDGFVWALIDSDQKLAKVKRACVKQDVSGGRDQRIFWLVQELVQALKKHMPTLEVLYTTMRPLAYQTDVLRDLGFRVLGIFPNGKEIDSSLVNSLETYFYDNVLEKNRPAELTLHPLLMPLYDIVRQECILPKVTEYQGDLSTIREFEVLPKLDILKAPSFVAHRFEKLRSRQSLSSQFYPFHAPNALITDLNQSIEVFVKIFTETSMATIVGERLELGVNPIDLYKNVARILREHGILYVEMINDAADALGTEALIQAGYLPCAYFPALKKQNNVRRDYVVFARSFENFFYPDLGNIAPVYRQYLKQYYEYEKLVFHRFIK
ncbi:MAG: hypothetical protein JNL11_13825 [Bdellovibrionaceae bacterium]|nr:hypothetical protein [Pseudobdellovibrionaceae bacterium]